MSSFAQKVEKVDEFQKPINCGNFMSRIDNVYALFKKAPSIKIYVIYYGGEYRRNKVWNEKAKKYEIQLEPPHREDGRNWAKSVSLYLTTFRPFPKNLRESIKDSIFLIDGGFRETTQLEIWVGSKDSKTPKAVPTMDIKNIKFRKGKPLKTPDYTQCYEGQYN